MTLGFLDWICPAVHLPRIFVAINDPYLIYYFIREKRNQNSWTDFLQFISETSSFGFEIPFFFLFELITEQNNRMWNIGNCSVSLLFTDVLS